MAPDRHTAAHIAVLAAALLCMLSASTAADLNDRPVIGIMAIPCDDCSHNSYIAASYIKYLESGGAQVAPIQFSASDADLLRLLSRVNGFFFTGGGASLDPTSQYFHAVSVIYNFTVQANQQGDYFPLWGTCLGFESICRAQSMDPSILSSFSAENITLPLSFTAKAKASRLFASTEPGSADAFRMLASEDITMNNHVAGVTPADFANNDRLNSFFDVLSTNLDLNGKEFVSLIESKTMPIWGSQFHPEKNVYEWWPREVMKHTRDAVFAANYLAEFFVAQTHLNKHSFPSAADRSQALIDNYTPVFTDGEFTQEYYFD